MDSVIISIVIGCGVGKRTWRVEANSACVKNSVVLFRTTDEDAFPDSANAIGFAIFSPGRLWPNVCLAARGDKLARSCRALKPQSQQQCLRPDSTRTAAMRSRNAVDALLLRGLHALALGHTRTRGPDERGGELRAASSLQARSVDPAIAATHTQGGRMRCALKPGQPAASQHASLPPLQLSRQQGQPRMQYLCFARASPPARRTPWLLIPRTCG